MLEVQDHLPHAFCMLFKAKSYLIIFINLPLHEKEM